MIRSINPFSHPRDYRIIEDAIDIQRKIEKQNTITNLNKSDTSNNVSAGLDVSYNYTTPESFSYSAFPDKTEFFTIQNLALCKELSCCVEIAELLGDRRTQEDSFVASSFKIQTPNAQDHTVLLTGVLDGHAGKEAALYVKDTLQKKLNHLFSSIFNKSLDEKHPLKAFENETTLSDTLIWNVLKIACVELHDDLPHRLSGTTAAFSLLIDGEDLWHANVGDSRSILTSQEKTIQLSEDMKMRFGFLPGRSETQFNNIEAAFKRSAPTVFPKDLNSPLLEKEKLQLSNSYERSIWKRGGHIGMDLRLNDCLATPRSIGDKTLESGLCPRPKITKTSLSKEFPDSEFCTLVHACDGLWDVTTTEQVAEAINNNPASLAQAVGNLANSAVQARVTHPSEENPFPSDNVSIVTTRIDLQALREIRK